jgi:PAS domain S-box-containing protein
MATNLAGHQRSLPPVLEECTAEHQCETDAGTAFCDSIIGHSPAIRKALDRVRLVAPTDTTVLIQGAIVQDIVLGLLARGDSIESAKSKNDFPRETSMPNGTVSLESILFTEELHRRPWRPPDYRKENRALVGLARALADSKVNILQKLAETILDATECDSAGISLLTKDDGGKRFYWPAIAGVWNPHIGGGTPRNFGPCGDVLDRDCTLLFQHFERRYPYLLSVMPSAEECLLVPFYVGGKAVGTIWAIMHTDRRKFDAEDERLMSALGQFASLAYQTLESIDDLKVQIAAREKAETASRERANGLEAKIRCLLDANVMGIVIANLEGAITEANEAFLRIVQYGREDLVSGRVRWTDLTPPEWRDRSERAVAQLRATGIFQPFEKEYFRKNGSRVPVLVGGAVFEENGNEHVAFVLDLSEQKRTEETLRRSEAYLAEAQRLTRTGAWAFYPSDPERSYWSSEYYRIYGFDPVKDPARYSAVLERIHPDDRARRDRKFKEALHKKEEFEDDFRIILPDGTKKHLHMVAHPVIDQAGDVVEFVGTSMDVTEQYQNRAALEKAVEEIRTLKDQLYRENLALRDEVDWASMFEEIVGTSKALQTVLSLIAKVGPTDSTVFITGETGTGKELIARAVHKRSRRSGRAFVSVNCAALTPSLISSELFGHEKGAFTGAMQRRLGRFELADGGTIFLDEVGELPPDTQAALLRVLQERKFERVGGAHSIHVDVRVIAATNRDLKAAVANGSFRQDLFYRLNVFPIEVPPLRERKDDILMLVEYFVQRYASRTGKNIRSIDKRTLELFQSYEWPGNIRELQNIIERSVILSSRDVFSVDESWFSRQSSAAEARVQSSPAFEGAGRSGREMIEAALAESRGRVSGPSGAAAKLRIPPSTLESRIKALKIRKSDFKFG